ncbi:hypothetical protein Bca52824_017314 [Brassica carinata]|uniref:Uncharacterized protein n=1 Tax=Brassica carinata TaxID=52824 RepID=A0A8X7VN36_BRACI|nr:hypothetical protein Bca52824_017314 [Brassica carinata]
MCDTTRKTNTVAWRSSLPEARLRFWSKKRARRHEKTETPWLKLEMIHAVDVVVAVAYNTIKPSSEMQLHISQQINQII